MTIQQGEQTYLPRRIKFKKQRNKKLIYYLIPVFTLLFVTLLILLSTKEAFSVPVKKESLNTNLKNDTVVNYSFNRNQTKPNTQIITGRYLI
jgi:hypothetical protein